MKEKNAVGKIRIGTKKAKKKSKIYLTLGFTTVEVGEVLERRCMQEAPKAMLEVCLPVGLR